MMMRGDSVETAGTLLRIPSIAVGSLTLRDVAALGVGTSPHFVGNMSLFDWYSTKNAVPVAGWFGGNVLRHYRITIDYPRRTMYWLAQPTGAADDLTTVGLMLRRVGDDYVVAGVATKNGKPTVDGMLTGDKLIAIDSLRASGASLGEIYTALRGRAGERRRIIIERDGERRTIVATVTEF